MRRRPTLLLPLLALLIVASAACRGSIATAPAVASGTPAADSGLLATARAHASPTAVEALATPMPHVSLFQTATPTTSPVPTTATPGPQASPQAGEIDRLDVVRAGYDLLLDDFYKQLDPRDLLSVAWTAFGDDAAVNNDPPPPPLPALAEDRDAAFATFQASYDAYQMALAVPLAADADAQKILDAIASSLENDHTGFLTPASYQSFLKSVTGQQQIGFGMRVLAANPRVVARTAPSGPADQAGFMPGDTIVKLAGVDVRSMRASEFSYEFASAREPIKVTVARGDQTLNLSLSRGPYFYPPWESRLLPDGVAYLRLDSFLSSGRVLPDGQEILDDLDQRLAQFDAAQARGLILDLRDNSGGSVQTATEILGRFLPEQDLTIHSYDEHGGDSTTLVSRLMHQTQLPMVVLVNGNSASSSEATAAALEENGRALLVGKRTAGELATAQILPLPDDAGMEIATKAVETSPRHGHRRGRRAGRCRCG